MKKIAFLFLLCQSIFLTAQNKTVVTQNGEKIAVNLNANNGLTIENGYTQLGGVLNKPTTIQTNSTNTLALSGLISSTDSNDSPIVAASDGTLKKGAFPSINIVPNSLGTVIAVNGKLEVAQEITSQMSADYTKTGSTSIFPIGNITNVIMDNKSRFTSSATGNSFTVETNGVYLITLNVQASSTNNGGATGSPMIFGVIDNSTGKWIARISDSYPVINNIQSFTLFAAIPMVTGRSYTFAGYGTYNTTIYATSSGGTGSGPVSYYSVKRLK